MPLGWKLLGTRTLKAKQPALVVLFRTINAPMGSWDSISKAISLGIPS